MAQGPLPWPLWQEVKLQLTLQHDHNMGVLDGFAKNLLWQHPQHFNAHQYWDTTGRRTKPAENIAMPSELQVLVGPIIGSVQVCECDQDIHSNTFALSGGIVVCCDIEICDVDTNHSNRQFAVKFQRDCK